MRNILLKIDKKTLRLRKAAAGILYKRENGNEQLIVALVMIAISVALVIIFKDKISTLLTSFMTNVTTKINTALGV